MSLARNFGWEFMNETSMNLPFHRANNFKTRNETPNRRSVCGTKCIVVIVMHDDDLTSAHQKLVSQAVSSAAVVFDTSSSASESAIAHVTATAASSAAQSISQQPVTKAAASAAAASAAADPAQQSSEQLAELEAKVDAIKKKHDTDGRWCDASQIEASRECPQLEFVDAKGCDKVTERGLMAIATSCKRLKVLNCSAAGTAATLPSQPRHLHAGVQLLGVFFASICGVAMPVATFGGDKNLYLWNNCSKGGDKCESMQFYCQQSTDRFNVAKAFVIMTILIAFFAVVCSVLSLVHLIYYDDKEVFCEVLVSIQPF